MKKLACIMALGIALSLTACGNDQEDEVVDLDIQEGIEEEALATDEPEESLMEQETEPEEAVDLEALKEDADSAIARISDWSAKMLMGYFEMPEKLDDAVCAQVVGTAYYYTGLTTEHVAYEPNDSYMYVPAETVTSYSMNIFGHSLDLAEFPTEEQLEDYMVLTDEQGGLIVRVGDWGLAAPVYEITEVETLENGNVSVTVQYSMYDYEMQENAYELGNISYELLPTHDSEYGFFIMNFTINSTEYMDNLTLMEGEGTLFESALGYSITLPAAWDGVVAVNSTDTQDTFIATNCEEENYTGILFFITTVDGIESEIVYPDYTVAAVEGDTMYVVYYPTDVQFDEAKQDEYQSLQNQVSMVLDTFAVQ
ncbi:MAG TPA: hypothetical protein PLZ77_03775 [Lachnospiraceae bacterium]|nr:hypothetical protein [Lachnospiraceae bacterium]HPF29210.1 hypothetical protein [Lachnospiraceae bacterium]